MKVMGSYKVLFNFSVKEALKIHLVLIEGWYNF